MAFDTVIGVIKAETLSATTTVAEFTLGVRVSQNSNEYIYVYNAAANSKILTGQCAVLDGTASLSSGYSVTVTNAVAAVGKPFIVAQQTFATATYGFGLVKGLSLIHLGAAEISMDVGDFVGIGIDGGWVSAPVTASTGVRYGYMINSGITAATGKARVNLMYT